MSERGFVLLHGAGLGPWVWDQVVPSLEKPALAVEFPERSGSDEARKRLSLSDYTDCIADQVRQYRPAQFVLVAHSISGVIAPILIQRFRDRVIGFAGIGAAIPRQGSSFLATLPIPRRLVMAAVLRAFGTKPPEAAIKKSLCNDLEAEATAEVVQRFVPESRALYTTSGTVGFPDLPFLYVHLSADAEFGMPLQRRMAANLGSPSTAHVGAGHLPMLSRPAELADVLNKFMATSVDLARQAG